MESDMKIWLMLGVPFIIIIIVGSLMVRNQATTEDKPTVVNSFVEEIEASQERTITQPKEVYKKLLVIQDYVERSQEWFNKSLTDKVARLMARKLMKEPGAVVGKVYRASIVIEFSGPVDGGDFIRHGEITFEEGAPLLEGVIWENIR